MRLLESGDVSLKVRAEAFASPAWNELPLLPAYRTASRFLLRAEHPAWRSFTQRAAHLFVYWRVGR